MHQMNVLFDCAEISVGQHYYWTVGNFTMHGQVLLMSWLVFALIALVSFLGNRELATEPSGFQNLNEYFTEYIRDLTKTQVGDEAYESWVPFVGTLFLFIFVSNWTGGAGLQLALDGKWRSHSLVQRRLTEPTYPTETSPPYGKSDWEKFPGGP